MNDEPALYIVGTPIGNLGDMTKRAVDTLTNVACVYAEDTRVSRKLLTRYEISTPLRSYREAAESYSRQRTEQEVIARLRAGESIAYVSDAGTPGLSDPGSLLVAAVRGAGYRIIPIPGPSALAAILSVSGLPILRPLFVGFLPKKKGHQTLVRGLKATLESEVADAVVLYESPERIISLLSELSLWELPLTVVLGRELTKQFEEVLYGPIAEVLENLSARKTIKGEIVVLITLL